MKKFLTILAIFALAMCTVFAQGSRDSASAVDDGTIVINYPTYRVGTNVTAGYTKVLIDSFNEHFEGKYKVVIEELPSDVAYQEKMAILATTNDLPDIVEGKGPVIDLAIRNGQAVDLTPFFEKDPGFRAEVGMPAIESNTINGKIYGVPPENQAFGYFYNKEMFKKAGIKPAETWGEWMDNLEKLKRAGYIPLTFFTGENSWTTQNVLVSIVGTQNAESNAMMNSQVKIVEWDTPEMVYGLSLIQKMFQNYCSEDAVGGVYANVANYFLQEKAAIMPNGSWMIPDFSNPDKATQAFFDKVGVSMFPNSGMIANYDYGYMICTKDPKKLEACWEFIKWFNNAEAQRIKLEVGGSFPIGPKVEITDDFKAKNPLLADLVALMGQVKYTYKTMNKLAYPNLVYDGFQTIYPELIYNKITPQEMVLKMTEISKKN
ncbi:ABC-type sugar transport system, periplasmic component [Sphaerochaeta pleomorpha str. Grapes]|uniref:ABC-type sugar transport system, periplasmic component n=1 Tax=Sphaerochaeta pleomorpha (strain ATCC BAA-1885 / DSM 22778 / Grapes) TaxID=158190 RepID=G8QTE9_SPHPG|nr:extracellular solute-binding protein [Sphaerochaeta pleomorpha]AEV30190.1 ABC-type sugar transport system, periplasmic component [Sphaerochaeta pleomorpha str. Grapes]